MTSALERKLDSVNLYKLASPSLLKKMPPEPASSQPKPLCPIIFETIVGIYNEKHLNEEHRYNHYPIDQSNIEPSKICGFSISWWVSKRATGLNKASSVLKELTGAEDDDERFSEMTSRSVHHLIFLFKLISVAKKTEKIWSIFALTTNRSYHVVAPYLDFEFTFNFARRVCRPKMGSQEFVPISGESIGVKETLKKEKTLYATDLSSFGKIMKTFTALLRNDCRLYELDCFKADENSSKQVQLHVSESKFQFSCPLSLYDLASICDASPQILTDSSPEGFEILDKIVHIPRKDSLTSELETALFQKVYRACYDPDSPIDFEFYHHKYSDFKHGTNFSLKISKTCIESWDTPPNAQDIVSALCKHIESNQIKRPLAFIKLVRSCSVHFIPYRKRKSTSQSLPNFIKGEVQVNGAKYFYLDANWCRIQGEYYAALQREFCRSMSQIILKNQDPGALPYPWVNNKTWYVFKKDELIGLASDDEEKKNQEATLELLLTKELIKKIEVKDNNKKYTGFEVSTNPADLPSEDEKKINKQTRDFLQHYYNRKVHFRKKEEEYNRRYFDHPSNQPPTTGYIVGDQIFPSKDQHVELFDIAYYTEDTLWLYHVKAGLGNTTRDACSQIRIAATLINNALSATSSSSIDILDLLATTGLGKSGTSSFAKKTKQQFENLGNSEQEIRENFKNLFLTRKNKIRFVYAFLDNKKVQRSLETELTKDLEVRAKDFNNDCRTFLKPKLPKLTNKAILQSLKDEGFITQNSEGKYFITDKFLTLKGEENLDLPIFQVKDRQGNSVIRVKNRKAIYKALLKRIPAFESVIAKKELIDLKNFMDGLPFELQVQQIPIDEVEGLFSSSSSATADTSFYTEPSFPENYEVAFPFSLRGTKRDYEPQSTSGDYNACALHALTGSMHNGTIIACKDSANPGLAVKQEFLQKLEEKKENPQTQELLKSLFRSSLVERVGNNTPHPQAVELYKNHPEEIEELQKSNNSKYSQINEAGEKRDLYLAQKLQQLQIQTSDENAAAFLKEIKAIFNKKEDQDKTDADILAYLQDLEKAKKLANANYNALLALMDQSVQDYYAELLGQEAVYENTYSEIVDAFLNQEFENLYQRYHTIVPTHEYMLNLDDFPLAAYLYEKKNVFLISEDFIHDNMHYPDPNDNTLQPHNPDPTVEEHLLIIRKPGHFEQCIQLT